MRLLLVLFLVPLSICNANTKFPLSQDIIDSIFGTVPLAAAPAKLPVENATAEVEYLDVNQYVPSQADYDIFDWSLTKRIATSSGGNFLVSPLGLKLALAILTEAASGTTQKELASVLGFEDNTHIVRQKFTRILDSLQTKSSHYTMDLGSRIYIGAGVEPQQRYAAIAKEFYRTEVINQDFTDPAAASAAINQWVSNTTHGRIPQLVDIDDVSGVVALVLNTLFFKGTWQHQFYPNDTRQDFFYLSGKEKKSTPFMSVKNKFYYADSAKFNAKILRMPYLGNKFAMYIVVPNSISGLAHVFTDVSSLRNELFFLQESIVDVVLPKFQFEYTSLLDGLLKELGIRQAFEDTASFPGIARGQALTQKLKISKVLQRSGIEVNELGSVAYSATEIALENKFGGDNEPAPEVIANKPFLFFIQDEATRQLLFTGRVSDPTLFDGAYKLP